jgi:hypothetical protein
MRFPYSTALAISAASRLLRIERSRALLIGMGRQEDIALRNLVFVARWKDQIIASPSLVDAGRTGVLERHLPAIHDGTGDRAIVGWGNFEDHGTRFLRAEERHEVDSVGVGREILIFPIRQAGPIEDLAFGTFGIVDH